MIKLNNNLAIEFSPFTDLGYLPDLFIFQEGSSGVLPRLKIRFNKDNDTCNSSTIRVKVAIDSALVINSTAYIYNRSYDNEQKVTFDCYLVPLDFVYQSYGYSFKNLNEVVAKLWSGKIRNIPNNNTLSYYTQGGQIASEYLTKALLSMKSKFLFAYNLNNELVGKDITDMPDISIKHGDEYEFLNKEFATKYNPLSGQDLDTYEEVVTFRAMKLNQVRYSSKESQIATINYMDNRSILLRHNETAVLNYIPYGSLKINDVIKLQFSNSVIKNYRALYTEFSYLDSKINCNTRIGRINE